MFVSRPGATDLRGVRVLGAGGAVAGRLLWRRCPSDKGAVDGIADPMSCGILGDSRGAATGRRGIVCTLSCP